jgi:hypothetical protein
VPVPGQKERQNEASVGQPTTVREPCGQPTLRAPECALSKRRRLGGGLWWRELSRQPSPRTLANPPPARCPPATGGACLMIMMMGHDSVITFISFGGADSGAAGPGKVKVRCRQAHTARACRWACGRLVDLSLSCGRYTAVSSRPVSSNKTQRTTIVPRHAQTDKTSAHLMNHVTCTQHEGKAREKREKRRAARVRESGVRAGQSGGPWRRHCRRSWAISSLIRS